MSEEKEEEKKKVSERERKRDRYFCVARNKEEIDPFSYGDGERVNGQRRQTQKFVVCGTR